MKLYHWEGTQCNQLYSGGDILVMASSLEEAISIATDQASSAYIGYKNMKELHQDVATESKWFADDAREDIAEVMATLKEDLSKTPKVYETPTAIFINGGE